MGSIIWVSDFGKFCKRSVARMGTSLNSVVQMDHGMRIFQPVNTSTATGALGQL